ncbi:MAG TPA: type II toxin-antitoxin system VapC family toxin [Actinomycetota bacterium]
MTLVVDASLVVAAFAGVSPLGSWADSVLDTNELLSAPHLMPVEAANILRREALLGHISADAASIAHADVTALPVELFPYVPLAARIWELRPNLTAYDAWYVALAEYLDARLATLDLKLAKAHGPRCGFVTPP